MTNQFLANSSSHVKDVKYDAASQTLDVTFHPTSKLGARTYRHVNVSPFIAKSFSASKSPGTYYAQNLRMRYGARELKG